MGGGSMNVDLRDVDLPAGRTDLRVEIGMGEIRLLVPDDVCVTTDAKIGVGAVNVGDGEEGGVDVDVTDRRTVDPDVPHLHVIADVGLGAVHVGDRFFHWDGPGDWRRDRFDELETGTSRAACLGAA